MNQEKVAIVINVFHVYTTPIIENKIKGKQKWRNGLLLLAHQQFKLTVGD
jgi:hypothetical protein